ncbi:hypothetical protein [Dokdonella sp.]|uniref:hypothetical protein n=1 Tax=Dokdonella sp. TaxID=2291710 RepID=UPI003C37B36F
MHGLRPQLFWLIAPLFLALWLVLVTPAHWLGVETGALGTGLLLVTTWVGLWWSTRLPVDPESAISPGEVRAWVALVFTSVIAAFMVANAGVILGAERVADLRGVGRTLAMLVIGWLIFSSILRQRLRGAVQEDERDRDVERRSQSWAHSTTCILVIGLAVTLGLTPAGRLDWARPMVIAHLLILMLVLSSLVACVVSIRLYRRDRL